MNTTTRLSALAAAVLAGAACLSAPAHAAESYDNCTGFIDTLPATISTQGTWCLRKNLVTGITSGHAITIETNNVTIDCNGYKVGGLMAGETSAANGIYAYNRMNATVRDCGIRGFFRGVALMGAGGGYLVEDNRLDQNLYIGIVVESDAVIRGNRVYDTGGSSSTPTIAYAILGGDQISDNIVDGMFATTSMHGIYTTASYAVVERNTVRALVDDTGYSAGIRILGVGGVASGNRVLQPSGTTGYGVNGTDSFCSENTVHGLDTPFLGCEKTVGDLSMP